MLVNFLYLQGSNQGTPRYGNKNGNNQSTPKRNGNYSGNRNERGSHSGNRSNNNNNSNNKNDDLVSPDYWLKGSYSNNSNNRNNYQSPQQPQPRRQILQHTPNSHQGNQNRYWLMSFLYNIIALYAVVS